MEKIDFIQTLPFFADFSDSQLNKVARILVERKYPKGSMIFMEDEYCDKAYILKKGKVKASKFSEDGKEFLIRFFEPGDFFGEACLLLKDGHYPISATVYEDSEVYYLTKSQIKDLVLQNPEIGLSLLEVYSSKILYLMKQINELSTKNVKSRIVKFLQEQIPKDQRNHTRDIRFQLIFSRSEIASKLGTVREQVSRILSKMSQEGIISIQGKNIIIHDLDKLK